MVARIQPVPLDSGDQFPKSMDLRRHIRATNKLQCLAVVDSHKRAFNNEKFKFIK
jgi:hypothetical protein